MIPFAPAQLEAKKTPSGTTVRFNSFKRSESKSWHLHGQGGVNAASTKKDPLWTASEI